MYLFTSSTNNYTIVLICNEVDVLSVSLQLRYRQQKWIELCEKIEEGAQREES